MVTQDSKNEIPSEPGISYIDFSELASEVMSLSLPSMCYK